MRIRICVSEYALRQVHMGKVAMAERVLRSRDAAEAASGYALLQVRAMPACIHATCVTRIRLRSARTRRRTRARASCEPRITQSAGALRSWFGFAHNGCCYLDSSTVFAVE